MIKNLSVPILLLALIFPACGQEADSLRQRLYSEAPKKYEEFVQIAKKMKCRIVTKVIDSDTKQIIRETVHQNALSHDLALAIAEVKIQGPDKLKLKNGSIVTFAVRPRVIGKNARYSFHLARPEPEKDWVLAAYAPPEKIAKGSTLSLIDEDVLGGFIMHFWMRTVGLPNLLKDPTFVFKGGEYLADGKPGLARIFFNYGGPGSSSPHSEGFMVLDTEHYWCISEYAIKIGSGTDSWNQKVTTQYDVDKHGVPLCIRHVSIDTSSYLNVETITEIKIERHSGIPEREFTLTAFGLPEPMGMPPVDRGGIRWYVWLSLAAFGALALGVSLRTLKRRYQNLEPVKKQLG